MRLPADQRNPHVRDRGTGQHTPVHFFLQVGQDQPLPVQRQVVRGNVRGKLQPAARRERFQPEVHLRVMAQGLIVADALHGPRDRLAVEDAAVAEGDLQTEAIPHLPLQYLQVDIAHGVHPDLPPGLDEFRLQEGFLLLEHPQAVQHLMKVRAAFRHDPAGKAGALGRSAAGGLEAEAVARHRPRQAGHAADLTRLRLRHGRKACPGIQADPGGLLGPGSIS